MAKRRLLIVMLLALVVVTCLIFAACDLFKPITPNGNHTHNYGKAWKSDETNHWHECSCGEKSDLSEHQFGEFVVDSQPDVGVRGSKHAICSVCNYRLDVSIPATDEEHDCEALPGWQSDATNHWHVCKYCEDVLDSEAHTASDWKVDVSPTTTTTGSKHRECTVCGYILETATIAKLESETRTVDFYAINDFHGEVDRISTISGYLKQQCNTNSNTVLINSGDMFQGSMESNTNYGTLLAGCLDDVGFDCFTIGNHEFDWGLSKLQSLSQSSATPFLAANIYHWDESSKTWGTFASELAKEYTTIVLDNGLKVGIIGVIGAGQITSISSQLVRTIGFKDPLPIIKSLSTTLRNDEGCDIVVVSAHTGPQELVGETESNQQPSSAAGLENYVDAVFCAHTHRSQVYTVDGLTFIQGGANGSYVSHIQLSVSKNGTISCTEKVNVSYSTSWPNFVGMQEKIDNSNALIAEEANQVLNTTNNVLNKNAEVPRLVCRAISDYALANYSEYPIAMAILNDGRSAISSGQITYSNLYEAIPFDNTVYIAKVKGTDIINEFNYGNYMWRVSESAIQSNNYYYIVVIDYLLFHQNTSRNYNYFPTAFTSGFDPIPLEKEGYESGMYNYRLITRDWLLEQNAAGKTIVASDYNGSNNYTNTSLITSAVTLDNSNLDETTTIQHAGTLSDPYTVSDALLKAAEASSASESSYYYVSGSIKDVSKASISNGEIYNIYIEDDDGNQIVLYYLKYNSTTDFTDTSVLSVGDTVVVYGKLFTYNSSKPEIYKGYFVSINGINT